jgi:hypothetical protein
LAGFFSHASRARTLGGTQRLTLSDACENSPAPEAARDGWAQRITHEFDRLGQLEAQDVNVFKEHGKVRRSEENARLAG